MAGVADRLAPDVREGLLESYATERGQVAHAMVGGVRRATSLITGRAGVARRIVGALGPRVLRRRRLRLALGRPLAGLEVTYSDSPLVVPGCRASGTRVGNAATSAGGRVLSRLDPHRYTWVVREPASRALGRPAGRGGRRSPRLRSRAGPSRRLHRRVREHSLTEVWNSLAGGRRYSDPHGPARPSRTLKSPPKTSVIGLIVIGRAPAGCRCRSSVLPGLPRALSA